jgi:hypothetical protein
MLFFNFVECVIKPKVIVNVAELHTTLTVLGVVNVIHGIKMFVSVNEALLLHIHW